MVEEFVEPDADDGDFRAQVSDGQCIVELLKLFRGKLFGVEAVLAGVLVAGLTATLALGIFVLIATEVVEGAFGGFFGDSESV